MAPRYTTRFAYAVLALLATALALAALRCLFVNPDLVAWRAGALAVGLLLGIWRLDYGILLCVWLTPLIGMLPRSMGVNDLSLPEHLMLPLLACGSVRAVRSRAARPSTAIDVPLAIYAIVVLLSAVRALGEYWALGAPVRSLVGPPLGHHFSFTILDFTDGPFLVVHYTVVALEGVLWFALLTAPGTPVCATALRAALVTSAAAVVLVGAAQAMFHFQMVAFFEQVQPGLNRINASLPDPNTLGSFLVLLWPLGLASALDRRGGPALAAGWTILAFYVLFRSVSRTAWASLAMVGLAATAAAAWSPWLVGARPSAAAVRQLRRAVVGMFAAGIVAVVAVSLTGLGRHLAYQGVRSPGEMLVFTLDLRRPASELLPARADHWRAAVNIWERFPLLGAGIGKYVLLKERYLPEARGRWLFFTEPHNYYLKILCELGVVGLAAFLAVLAGIGVQARRAWQPADRAGRRRVTGGAAGVAGFLLCLLAQDPLILREMQYVFWTLVAWLVLEGQHAQVSSSPSAGGVLEAASRTP